MIADAASNRARRRVVAGGVLAVHALAVWFGWRVHADRAEDRTATEPVFMTVTIALSRDRPQAALPAAPKQQDVLQLQTLAPKMQDVLVREPEVELPESPVVADTAPPASVPVTAQADDGAAGDARESNGRSGAGDGLVLLQRVLPVYPAAAARRGEQGITGVLLHITESGRVDDVRVERGSGSTDLDKAAVDAFRRWRFAQLPAGSGGRWLRTSQGFVQYQIAYSRLDAGALDSVYAEGLKPKSGTTDEATPGSREALLRFIAQVRAGTLVDPDGPSRVAIAKVRATLEAWGEVQSAQFIGIAGDSRWMSHGIRRDFSRDTRQSVDVSWNMFKLRHEKATSEWLIAMDRAGQVWAASAGQSPGM